MAKFTKRQILENIPPNGNLSETVNYVLKQLNICVEDACPTGLQRLKTAISTLRTKRNKKFEEVRRIKAKFEKKYSNWLDSEFKIPSIDIINHKQESSSYPKPGRPSLSFEKKSDRSKRRDAANISASLDHDPQRILQACRHAARYSGDKDLYNVINKISKSPDRPKKLRKLLEIKETTIVKKTAEEALAFLLDNSMSKNVYTNMRLEVKACGADIWPSYNKVREAKAQCRPPKEAISISETEVEVSLQALLNNTSERLIKLQREVILQYMESASSTEIEAVLLCSWGFDGSSGHSQYKQNYESDELNSNISDANMFATTLIPLRLLSQNNDILWNNRTSQSPRFCRPIKLQNIHESVCVILSQKEDIEKQIKQLQVLEVRIDDTHFIKIHFSLFLTLIDGKVLNTITGTKSMQTCPICHATPRTFNDLSNKKSSVFLPNVQALVYGISPLHAWIRIFECCLHISYRNDLKIWQIKGDKNKILVAQRKREIQDLLWKKLGLIVDKVKPGGFGTTNDGNTARRAFENTEILAECLGLNSELLKNLKSILIALSINLPINPYEFDKICFRTAKIYVENYLWYPMPATLHKILIHGADIISTSILPVGMLGEEASEARNKDYKNFRQNHSRKMSRTVTLTDIFYRLMDTSDVIISTINLHSRLQKRKFLSIPQEVKDLLAVPDLNVSNSNRDDDTEIDEELENLETLDIFTHLDDLQLSGEELDN